MPPPQLLLFQPQDHLRAKLRDPALVDMLREGHGRGRGAPGVLAEGGVLRVGLGREGQWSKDQAAPLKSAQQVVAVKCNGRGGQESDSRVENVRTEGVVMGGVSHPGGHTLGKSHPVGQLVSTPSQPCTQAKQIKPEGGGTGMQVKAGFRGEGRSQGKVNYLLLWGCPWTRPFSQPALGACSKWPR